MESIVLYDMFLRGGSISASMSDSRQHSADQPATVITLDPDGFATGRAMVAAVDDALGDGVPLTNLRSALGA